VTWDCGMPAMTARARRRPATPVAVRTQRGPKERGASSPEPSDKLHVRLFLDGRARCSVLRQDCGPRREGAAAPTGRAGRVTGGRCSCGPGPWLARR
jgi:hypothetical protein